MAPFFSPMKHDDDKELHHALHQFRSRYRYYQEKITRKYKRMGDIDTDVVQSAWNQYARLRKSKGLPF